MTAIPIAMPRFGMTMREGRVTAWLAAPGERVVAGQAVAVVEAELAELRIEAPAPGYVRQHYVEPDEVVPCGTLLMAVSEHPDEIFDPDAFRRRHNRPDSSASRVASGRASGPAGTGSEGRPPITPAARRRARELGVSLAAVRGTGPAGRVTAEDVEAHAEEMRDRVVLEDGSSLEVPRAGSGEPLLLLPGFGLDVSPFARQAEWLIERFRVFGVNPRGVGDSDPLPADVHPLERAVADAAAVVAGGIHVVGTGLGALLAADLALRHPQRLRSLALIAPLAHRSARVRCVLDLWSELASELPAEQLAAVLLPWHFSARFLSDERARLRVRRGLAAILARVPAATLARTVAGLDGWQPEDRHLARLAELRVPTLVVTGDDDPLAVSGGALEAALPTARHVRVPDAGHAVLVEAPDAVGDALRKHLAEAAGTGTRPS